MKIRNINLGNYFLPITVHNGVCLEIGANVGSFTERIVHFFRKIHSYEPITKCFNIVKSKVEKYPHIKVFNLAGYKESNKEFELNLHKDTDSGSTTLNIGNTDLIVKGWTNKVVNKIKTISLEDMIKNLQEEEIDYLKCDCEMSEYEIFMNKDLSKIRYLALELHPQLGKNKWKKLIKHIFITHKIFIGKYKYKKLHREVLFVNKKNF